MRTPEFIKQHVQKMLCPVHDVYPIVEEDWDGFKIACCCKEFEKICLKEAETLLQQNQ